jgi:hypothetical protein
MLSRRAFVGGLISIPVLFAPSLFSKATNNEYYNGLGSKLASMASYDNPIKYKGWNIYRWTGWKGVQNNYNLVGQWIATDMMLGLDYSESKGRRHLYSSSPGHCFSYKKGAGFDISKTGNQTIITDKSSESEKDRAIYNAYSDLTKLIDKIEDGSFGPWPAFWEPRSFYSK